MTTTKRGGCYKRLPGGAVLPRDEADQVLAQVAPAAKPSKKTTRTADTVPAASGADTVAATTEIPTGGN